MKVDVLNMQGEKVRQVELPAAIFEAKVNTDLMHQAFQRQMANARLGTHQTKVRGEVAGGGRSLEAKGTGRAARDRRSRSVGRRRRLHTHPENTRRPCRARWQAALRSALSAKAIESGIVVVDELKFNKPKTSAVALALKALVGKASALVLLAAKDEDYDRTTQAGGNIPDAKILLASYLNVRDLMSYDKVILPLKSLDVLTAHLGKE
jgi:large subunit ribosomal protein L4